MHSKKTNIIAILILLTIVSTSPVKAGTGICSTTTPGTFLGTWFSGIGPLGNSALFGCNFDDVFVSTMSNIIGLMTAIGGLWFIFTLFTGALAWIGAGSDKQALDNAKKKITNGLIGLLVVVISYALIGVVGFFIGFDILNLKALIKSLNPGP